MQNLIKVFSEEKIRRAIWEVCKTTGIHITIQFNITRFWNVLKRDIIQATKDFTSQIDGQKGVIHINTKMSKPTKIRRI